jgi:hypothetical protein
MGRIVRGRMQVSQVSSNAPNSQKRQKQKHFFFKSENLRASLDVVLQETLSVIDFFSLVSDVFLQVVFC